MRKSKTTRKRHNNDKCLLSFVSYPTSYNSDQQVVLNTYPKTTRGRMRKNFHLPLPNNAEGVTGGGGGAWTIGGAAGSS